MMSYVGQAGSPAWPRSGQPSQSRDAQEEPEKQNEDVVFPTGLSGAAVMVYLKPLFHLDMGVRRLIAGTRDVE